MSDSPWVIVGIILHVYLIIIAHRLSTIQNCDKIVIIDGGKIIGEGKHDYLIKNNPTYIKLIKMQNIT